VSPTELADVLEHARSRTEALLEPLDDEELTRQVSPLQSPLVWDLAHIGYFEELCLLRKAGGREPLSAVYDELYDSFAHGRSERAELPILEPAAARAYVREVREAVVELLPELARDDDFLVGMVAQHELQHGETMAQTLALAGLLPERPPEVTATGDVLVPGFVLVGAALIPYVDRADITATRPSQRKTAVILFTLFCILGLVLTFVGIFFRGPGYTFIIPYVTAPGMYFSL